MQELVTVKDNKVILAPHLGQYSGMTALERFIFIFAGTQSGKTSWGSWWLVQEIERCGPGDYLAVTATYDLFKLKMLPEMKHVFCDLLKTWKWEAVDRLFSRSDGSRIILRSASSPEGLEAATAKAAWLDECGQDSFTLLAWEAVLRRLSLSEGRILGTTTIYNLGWIKNEVYDKWKAKDKDFRVIQFSSLMNPSFPKEEFERARRTLPPWKFAMQYLGEFARPAGMIYDCFTDAMKIPPFLPPKHWPKYGGLDFGGVHTAAVCIAVNPQNGTMYVIREYLEGGKTAKEHADVLKSWGCRLWVGGSKSEEQWRHEFAAAGMPITEPPINDVEVGIQRVYAAHKTNQLFAFDILSHYLDEKGRYSRKLDASGQPTEDIKDKNDYHMMDAERYVIAYLRNNFMPLPENQPEAASKWHNYADQEAGGWGKFNG